MKNILVYGCSTNYGGIERYLDNYIQSRGGDNITLLLDFEGETPLDSSIRKYNIRTTRVCSRRRNYYKYIKDIKKLFRKQHFDIVYFNLINYSPFELLYLAKKQKNTKVIIHSHTSGRITDSVITKLLNIIGKNIARNNKTIRLACGIDAGKYLFGNKDFQIINNGVNESVYKFNNDSRKRIREEFGVTEKEYLIGNVASFLPIKNQQFMIRLLGKCNPKKNNIKLLFVGDGIMRDTCEKIATELGIEENVIFAGKRKDVSDIYSAMDLFVMPSIVEGVSFSILEAQVNGLSCIMNSSVDKMCDISGNVYFVSLDDEEKWRSIILKKQKRLRKTPDKLDKAFLLENSMAKLEAIIKSNS